MFQFPLLEWLPPHPTPQNSWQQNDYFLFIYGQSLIYQLERCWDWKMKQGKGCFSKKNKILILINSLFLCHLLYSFLATDVYFLCFVHKLTGMLYHCISPEKTSLCILDNCILLLVWDDFYICFLYYFICLFHFWNCSDVPEKVCNKKYLQMRDFGNNGVHSHMSHHHIYNLLYRNSHVLKGLNICPVPFISIISYELLEIKHILQHTTLWDTMLTMFLLPL
jgi:hypothetical protein